VKRIPVACTLKRAEFTAQSADWEWAVARFGRARNAVDQGVEVILAADAHDEVARLVDLERSCCGWATWQLDRDGNEVRLRVTSPDAEGADVLRDLFGLAPA